MGCMLVHSRCYGVFVGPHGFSGLPFFPHMEFSRCRKGCLIVHFYKPVYILIYCLCVLCLGRLFFLCEASQIPIVLHDWWYYLSKTTTSQAGSTQYTMCGSKPHPHSMPHIPIQTQSNKNNQTNQDNRIPMPRTSNLVWGWCWTFWSWVNLWECGLRRALIWVRNSKRFSNARINGFLPLQ